MIILSINNNDYHLYDNWSEITLDKARELYGVALDIPEPLNLIYKEKSKGDDCDSNQLEVFAKDLDEELFYRFSCRILSVLSDIPKDVIDGINKVDILLCYETYLMPFVFGCLYYPLDKMEDLKEFTTMGETFKAPKEQEVMGTLRAFANENTEVFCDASDIDSNGKRNKSKYDNAELIIGIVYRRDGEEYSEETAMENARFFNHLTCDVYHAAIYQLSKVNVTLKGLFPNLYQKGNAKASKASNVSGLTDFGWFNSIMTIAKMGVLNEEGLTPLESVRKSNLYTFMTVLSSMRADNDFQRVFNELNASKK